MRRYLIIGIVGVVAAAAAIVLTYWPGEDSLPEPKLAVETPGGTAPPGRAAHDNGIPVPAPPPVAAFKPGSPQQKKAGTPPAASTPQSNTATAGAPAAAPGASPELPEFDVVRVNPDGDAVIAGRAAPGAKVGIYDGDKLAGTVTADSRGEWVFLPPHPLPSGQRELSLALIGKDGSEKRTPSAVVLSVPERKLASATPATGTAKPDAKASDGVLAVLVSRDGKTPSRVLQKPQEENGVGDKKLSIGVIDYDEKGNMSIGGKGKPGTKVQVYIDNNLASKGVAVSPEGRWEVSPDASVGPGVHKLRVDGLVNDKVVARVEMPFSRAKPPAGSTPDEFVVVQPGNSLWRIARRTMGSGIRYTEIYAANQSQIVDPDLIYPGQVFSLPESN